MLAAIPRDSTRCKRMRRVRTGVALRRKRREAASAPPVPTTPAVLLSAALKSPVANHPMVTIHRSGGSQRASRLTRNRKTLSRGPPPGSESERRTDQCGGGRSNGPLEQTPSPAARVIQTKPTVDTHEHALTRVGRDIGMMSMHQCAREIFLPADLICDGGRAHDGFVRQFHQPSRAAADCTWTRTSASTPAARLRPGSCWHSSMSRERTPSLNGGSAT